MKALAMDIGASSGKMFLGEFDGERILLREVHRFPNEARAKNGHLYWDFRSIHEELIAGLIKTAGDNIDSFGVDSFCNDYGLLDQNGRLISEIHSYRDSRTEAVMDQMSEKFSLREMYNRTGCQRARFNTLVQLIAEDRGKLQKTSRLLFLSDLLNYTLCGAAAAEYTTASVSQIYNHTHADWDEEILSAYDIPAAIMPGIVPTSKRLGTSIQGINELTGTKPFSIVTVGQHDTASAVAAVPSNASHFAYISSGTWSLMGTELDSMITTDAAYDFNFANEGGVGMRIRFLKNIMGLWLLQECQRDLSARGKSITFEELDREADGAEPFRSIINPDDPAFFEPGNMVEKIQAQCRASRQPEPQTPGEITRCIKESLVLAYRKTLEKIEKTTGFDIPVVHIIGGGANSALMNQWTADSLRRPIHAGPFEAAAVGNLCAQFMAAGEINGLDQARQVVRNSFEIVEYSPRNPDAWDDAYGRFMELIPQQPS